MKGKNGLNSQFLEETIFAIADGYCMINLTKNIVPGVMYQVIDGKKYNLNEQVGLPENASFTDLVSAWSKTIPEEGLSDFLEEFNRETLLERFDRGETHVSFYYWTRTAKFESMLAEDHIAMFYDEETKNVMAINYVLDRTEQYRLTKQKNRLENLLGIEKEYSGLLSALGRIYWQIFSVDLKENTYNEIYAMHGMKKTTPKEGLAQEAFFNIMNQFVLEEYKYAMSLFLDHTTLPKRLSKEDYVREEFVDTNGSWMEASYIVQQRDNDGKVTHVLFTLLNVDEKKQKELSYQRRLKEAAAEAKRANEMKSRFLSSISHDIRTPINGIQGMLRIADTFPKNMKKQNECREKMWIASNHLVSLVNNVLDMNRLESNQIELKEEPFNLIDLLMSITSMADMQIDAKELHSIVDWKPGYIEHRYVIGSAEGLSRILMNLNSNAIKYNKKGGTIYCRCIEKECDGKTAWFEIINADTGIGMDKEFLKHAFDPYSQKNNSSISSINGVGLGLSIVKNTVELMGGTLKVESEVGKGTKYTIMLPFKINPNPHQEKKSLEHVSLNGVRALLVEDNELNMEIAKFWLEQEHVTVFTAMNGQEAVDAFEQSEIGFYDIILMDIQMPIMNGWEATKKIRCMNRADAMVIPIIAMSANAFEQDIEKSMQAGMNAHLAKPIDGDKVTETMKKYLANKIIKS